MGKPCLFGLGYLFVLGALGISLAQGAEGTLLIGQTADFSGPQSSAVKETTEAAKAYFDSVNKQGGVNGRRIVLESVDDGFDPKRTVANATKLITERKVLALMLSRGTANAEALIPVTRTYKTMVFAPVGGSELMHRPADHYLFNIRPMHRLEVEKAVAQLSAQGMRRIAVAYVDDALGNDGIKGAYAALKAANLDPAAIVPIPRGEPKVEAAVETLIKAKPDAVVGICIAKSCAALVKQLRARGSVAQFVSLSNTSSAGYVKDLATDARGVIVTQVYPYPFSDVPRVSKEFRALAAEYKLAQSYSAIEGFIAGKVMTEALRRAGANPTPQSLIAAMEKMDRYDVGGFVVDFAGHGRTGSEFMELTMISKAGRFIR
jgi:ABC-type branched-subunit amino acid transport system substrate-binding protein